MGTGRFVGPKSIAVALNDGGSRTLAGAEMVINVGTHAMMPAISGLMATQPRTHIEALALDYLPSHLVVLEGGYFGIEMAQAFRRLGSRVTIIEAGRQPMAREDLDVAREVIYILVGEGIDVLTDTKPSRATGRSGDSVSITVRTPDGERTIEGSDLLVATGRIAYIAEIELELTGVELDEWGFVCVNERLETAAAGIWPLGECAGSPQFTHVSVDDFKIVRDNMAGGNRRTDDRLIPYTVFTKPPLARVGLSEAEAARRDTPIRVSTLPMAHVLRTLMTDEGQGWLKAIVSAHDDRVLGFTMIGAEASEVLAAVQTAMIADLPLHEASRRSDRASDLCRRS